MAGSVVIDEVHVAFRVPKDLPEGRVEEVSRTLAGDEFLRRLRRAVRGVVRDFGELSGVRASASR